MTDINISESKRYPARLTIRIFTMIVFIASIFVGAMFNIFLLSAGFFKAEIIDDFWGFVLGVNLLLIFVVWVFGELAFNTEFVLNASGIRYRYLGMTGYANWIDVAGMHYTQMPRGYFDWVISLKKPLEWQSKKSKFIAKINRNHAQKYIALGSFLSLPKNEEDLHKTGFFADLMYYAPNLFENKKTLSSPHTISNDTSNNSDIDNLSDEMRKAYDLAFTLHRQGKDFQSILAALRDNTSLDFDERIEIMELLETEGYEVVVSTSKGTTLLITLTFGLIVLAVSIWVMWNETRWRDGRIIVISGIRVIWIAIAFGVFIILWSIIDLFKFYTAQTKRKAKQVDYS